MPEKNTKVIYTTPGMSKDQHNQLLVLTKHAAISKAQSFFY